VSTPDSAAPPPTFSPNDSASHPGTLATWPLLAWLLVQLTALLLAATRVPLAANYPRAADQLAVHLLLATQVVAAAALMPWLLRGWRASLLAAACCWPMLAVAGMLSALPEARMLAATGYVTAWLAVLSVWMAAAARSKRLQYVFSAVASAVAAGGPLLWYLQVEFTSPETAAATPAWQFGPVLVAFSLARGEPASSTGGLILLGLIAVGTALLWIGQRAARWSPTLVR
jgi:hypothetical protein